MRLTIKKVEDLQATRLLDQMKNENGHQLFGANDIVDRDGLGREEFGVGEIVGVSYPRQPRGGAKQGIGEMAGDHVGLVTVGDGQDEIGVLDTRLDQYLRVSGITRDRAQVETFLEELQQLGVAIDDRDVVILAGEAMGDRAANLAGTEDDDFHGLLAPIRGMAGINAASRPAGRGSVG